MSDILAKANKDLGGVDIGQVTPEYWIETYGVWLLEKVETLQAKVDELEDKLCIDKAITTKVDVEE